MAEKDKGNLKRNKVSGVQATRNWTNSVLSAAQKETLINQEKPTPEQRERMAQRALDFIKKEDEKSSPNLD